MTRILLLLCAALGPCAAHATCIPLGGDCANTSGQCCAPNVYSDPAQQTGCTCVAPPILTTSTTLLGQTTTTSTAPTTTLPAMSSPVIITAQDVSLKVHGGADYSVLHGHAADQYERDMMEQTLLGVWMPQVIAFMRALPACQSAVHEALTGLSTILQRLDVVHQYDDIAGPPPKTWQVTVGGRHYQIEYYTNAHAHGCALSDPSGCAANAFMTPELADLLDLSLVNGQCVDGAGFEPPGRPALSIGTLDGLADGRQRFPVTNADDAAALQTAVTAHLGGECGQTPTGSVQQAQLLFTGMVAGRAEMHYRTPQPFKGGCDPRWTADECCHWKALEHREYAAWSAAVLAGDWGTVRCFAARHHRMHICANLNDAYTIRMPPCDGSYPDLTPPVSCQQYLANPTP